MPIVPYDPFNFWRRDFAFPSFTRAFEDDWFDTNYGNMQRVRVDVKQNPTDVIITAEIPGLEKKEDVNITVHDNHLHLSGKIERMAEQQDESVHRTERYFGQFSRTVPLPASVDETGAKASYRNGILEITLPKNNQQPGHQIDVDFH